MTRKRLRMQVAESRPKHLSVVQTPFARTAEVQCVVNIVKPWTWTTTLWLLIVRRRDGQCSSPHNGLLAETTSPDLAQEMNRQSSWQFRIYYMWGHCQTTSANPHCRLECLLHHDTSLSNLKLPATRSVNVDQGKGDLPCVQDQRECVVLVWTRLVLAAQGVLRYNKVIRWTDTDHEFCKVSEFFRLRCELLLHRNRNVAKQSRGLSQVMGAERFCNAATVLPFAILSVGQDIEPNMKKNFYNRKMT